MAQQDYQNPYSPDGGFTGGVDFGAPQQQTPPSEDHSQGSAWDLNNLKGVAQQQQSSGQKYFNNNTGSAATYNPATGMYTDTNGNQIRPDAVVAGGANGPLPTNPGSGNMADTSGLSYSNQNTDLVNLLMKRANGSLNIDPNTDPIIRPQVDNYAATQTRNARNIIDQSAEGGNPYATGALQNTRTQAAEAAGQNTANLQSTLTQNELTARRKEIQDALTESGSLLTADQQISLQRELGLLDASLKQQQITSGNDQFMAQLGLQAGDRNNYWDAVHSGLIGG